MEDADHDKLICLYKRVELTEAQHERDILRVSRNVNTLIAVISIVVPLLTLIVLVVR